MKVVRGFYYETEGGRTDENMNTAAVLDVEFWLRSQRLTDGQKDVATSVCAALDEYPEFTMQLIRKYEQSLMDAREQLERMRDEK